METHKIDRLFKRKLDRHSEKVSTDAFAKMQAQMKGEKKKKGFPWMIAASVSIVLIVSFGLVYNFNRPEDPVIAKIELNDTQISLSDVKITEKPGVLKKEEVQQVAPTEATIMPLQKSKPSEVIKQDISRMASISKVSSFQAKMEVNIPELRLAPQKQENEVIVEIHYAYAETKKEENLLVKSNNKLKSLASEFSLAELRSAKNELFASALQFNKKENN